LTARTNARGTVPADWEQGARRLATLLEDRPNVSAFCHERPDGDTIGAAVAIALACRSLGCSVEVVAESIPTDYEPLIGDLPVHDRPHLDPGIAVACDAATLERIGRVVEECADWFTAATIVAVDHHITNDGFGDVHIVDADAAASCEVVGRALATMGIPVDEPIATALLAGILRDSNGFSAESTRPETLRVAADALDAGADLATTHAMTVSNLPRARMRLWGRLLASLEEDLGGRVVYATMTDADLAATATDQDDAEGLVEFLLRDRHVQAALLFRDLGQSTRVSVRTASGVDAAGVAAAFGGGGHRRRAGCVVEGAPDSVVPRVLAAARRAIA
jgi:phosphoesterase RecJ-like protein